MNILDSKEEMAKIDKDNLVSSILKLADQIEQAWREVGKIEIPLDRLIWLEHQSNPFEYGGVSPIPALQPCQITLWLKILLGIVLPAGENKAIHLRESIGHGRMFLFHSRPLTSLYVVTETAPRPVL